MYICRYTSRYKKCWDKFVLQAKNSHFFFRRDFMAYHQDRFEEYSLLYFDDKKHLIALLPANRTGHRLYSHRGLTFGGWIVSKKMKMTIMLDIAEKTKSYLKDRGIDEVIYKAIPYIYHLQPSEEDRYALFRQGAVLYKREVSTTIYQDLPLTYSNGRKWCLKKAKNAGLSIVKSENFALFWPLLENVLKKYHQAAPVHTLEEIKKLHTLFPANIHLFLVYEKTTLLCGGVVFENTKIAHLQYVANGEAGRKIGALDFLIDHLIQNVYKTKKYFDFGTSNEENGKILNDGLIDQKERFGASAVVHESFLWTL